jgi:cytochrome c oxidase cbb3-type subunit 1
LGFGPPAAEQLQMAMMPARTAAHYDYLVVRRFVAVSLWWGLAGMGIGVYLGALLAWPQLDTGIAELSYGRLRPLHTNLVILGFLGNALIGAAYYVAQRTAQVRLAGEFFAAFSFWGWQATLVLGALGLVLGYTQGREYAEFPWPLDLLMGLVWLSVLGVFTATLQHRQQPHIYVANWFLLAFLLMFMVLHAVDNLALVVEFPGMVSYGLYAGVQDALIHWWYGENTVGFLLGAGFLGLMYYFLPKQAARPVYSYRLSIVHFWSLMFLYAWLGPVHLHWSALPASLASLSVGFAILVVLPAWAGVVNGLLTLSGAVGRLRADLPLRFMVTALGCYGLASVEGPLLSLAGINASAHYGDWVVAHAHFAAMGWSALMVFGVLYHLAPRIWEGRIYSRALLVAHYWLSVIGVLLYTSALWWAAMRQGHMLRAMDGYGNLRYGFVETLGVLHLPYTVRLLGGGLFLLGTLLALVNLWLTLRRARSERKAIRARIAAKLGGQSRAAEEPA